MGRTKKQCERPELPSFNIGPVSFYNAELVSRGNSPQWDFIRCYVANESLVDGLIENGSKPITITRATWDALLAQATAKKEAA